MIVQARDSALIKLVCVSEIAMSGNIQQQRAAVEQLRREANIKRISVSQAVEDIKVRIFTCAEEVYPFTGPNPKISIH